MLNFPQSTYFNKRIPKQKFYDTLKISSGLEKLFVREIDTIHWEHKFSPETLNISAGVNVTEIEIITIVLKQQDITRTLLEIIDREIPYHIVYVLKYNEYGRIWINYKEESKTRKDKYTVDSSYKTEWMKFEELSLNINGLDLDKVYENFIIQVSGGKIKVEASEDLKDAVMMVKEKDKLSMYAAALENKIKNEKQFNRQVALSNELRKVKEELDGIQ